MRYQSTGNVVNAASGGAAVNVLGIDPGRAEGVIWFRSDFADQSLRSLLNLIASPGPNAIVSETFLQATGLHQGDTFQVTLTNTQTISARIAAVVRYFPSLDPRAYPFAVTNLAYLNAVSHGHGPNEMWLAANGQPRTLNRLVSIARRWPRQIVDYEGIPAGDNGADPLRVGIYGVVSVGFLISVGLALLGFLAYMYLSLQQRLAEFAIVRALGLSPSGMRSLLLYEHLFLLTGAMLGGIAAGVLTTQLFLPYLPIATNTVPPFLVVTPWRAVAAFVAAMSTVFVAVMSICVTLVLRLQLGNVLRLGER
jgi:putative ABC transport system permease protein